MTKDGLSENGCVLTTEEVVEVVEIIEIEVYARSGRKPPKAKHYRIRIDKTQYVVDVAEMSGRQLLELAGKVPPENYMLTMKVHGGRPKPIGLNDVASFVEPGVERFVTLPRDQTEG